MDTKTKRLTEIFTELGSGKLVASFIHDPGYATEGMVTDGYIVVNGYHALCNIIIHECLHRAHPDWSETYVRRTTTWLQNRLSDDDVIAVVQSFQKRATSKHMTKVRNT